MENNTSSLHTGNDCCDSINNNSNENDGDKQKEKASIQVSTDRPDRWAVYILSNVDSSVVVLQVGRETIVMVVVAAVRGKETSKMSEGGGSE